MYQRELIPDGETVNRNVFAPHMFKDNKFIIHGLFPFQTDRGLKESVIRRKYATSLGRVHELGCVKERKDNASRPSDKQISYVGTIEAIVGHIRGIQTERGHGFIVSHEPSEGKHHAHVVVQPASGSTILKNDKTDLRDELLAVFEPLIDHSC